MVRIEQKPLDPEKIRREIKKELESEIKMKESWIHRRLIGCVNCLISVIIVIALLVFGIGFFLAKSGIKDIPVLTYYFYDPPVPKRWVTVPEDMMSLDIDTIFNQKVSSVFGSDIDFKDLKNLDVGALGIDNKDIMFSEEELSVLFQQFIESQRLKDSSIKASYGQIVIEPDMIELYVVFTEPVDVRVIIWMVPEFINNTLSVEISQIRLGDIVLPDIFNRSASKIINPLLGKLNALIPDGVYIKDIVLDTQMLTIKGIYL